MKTVLQATIAVVDKQLGKIRNESNTPLVPQGDSFVVSVPVPGLSKKDLNVYLQDQVLVIAIKEQTKWKDNPNGHGQQVKHSFVVPKGIDINRIRAKCRRGLLTIKLEKMEDKKISRVIKVMGQEGHGRDLRENSLWDKIKSKLDLLKISPVRRNEMA